MLTSSRNNDEIIIESNYLPLEKTNTFLAVLSFFVLLFDILVVDFFSNILNPSYAKIFLSYFIVFHLAIILYFYLSVGIRIPAQLEAGLRLAQPAMYIGGLPVYWVIVNIFGQNDDPFAVAFIYTIFLIPIYVFLIMRRKSFMEITTHINPQSYTIDTSLNVFGLKSHRSKTFDTDNLDIRVAVFKTPIYLFILRKKDYKISSQQKLIEENSSELQGNKIFKLRFFTLTDEMTDQGKMVKEDISLVAKTNSIDEIEKLMAILLEMQSIFYRESV